MKSNKRLNFSELSLIRVSGALTTRIGEIPHLAAWAFSERAQKNKEIIRGFHNIHKNERCFLVANGPSLAQIDLSLIKDEISFGLNRIYVNFENSTFRPTYYVASNDLVIDQFHEDIAKLTMPKILSCILVAILNKLEMILHIYNLTMCLMIISRLISPDPWCSGLRSRSSPSS